jgi:hypothetical protein
MLIFVGEWWGLQRVTYFEMRTPSLLKTRQSYGRQSVNLFKMLSLVIQLYMQLLYSGVDKSLARPGRKQSTDRRF